MKEPNSVKEGKGLPKDKSARAKKPKATSEKKASSVSLKASFSFAPVDNKHRSLVIAPDGKLKLCAIDPQTKMIDLSDCVDAS